MSEEIFQKYLTRVTWFINSSIMIEGSKTLYFDPYGVIEDTPPADFIFATHPHLDNFAPECINRIMHEESTLLATHDASEINKHGHFVPVSPSQNFTLENISIQTVRAYNIDKRFHPKENNWVGFIVEMDGIRYYHAGDTDLIPEMDEIKNIDVAFLPVDGIYAMSAEEAVKAAEKIQPKVAVPIHFGMITGTYDDADYFVENCPVPSKILKVTR